MDELMDYDEVLASFDPTLGLEVHVELNTATLATFAYVGVFPSVVAYLFFNYGVARRGPARAAMFIHLMPAFGALLSTVFLGETLAWYHLAGISAIFLGLSLSTRGQ